MHRTRRTLLAVVLTLAAADSRALDPPDPHAEAETSGATPCAEAIAARVQHRYESVRDLSARFEQTSRIVGIGAGSLGSESAGGGTVVFAKPGKMRWSYETPAPSLVVTDGKTLWTYDPVLEEAQRLQVEGGILSGVVIQFLLGEGRITDSFEVSARSCGGKMLRLDLVPIEPTSYERLALGIDPLSDWVVETTVIDLFGNETVVKFSDIEPNRDPDDDVFRFRPPAGVQVIEIPTLD